MLNAESLLAMVVFEMANELNYIVILYIVGVCMNAHFWGRPDCRTGEAVIWDKGVTRA